MKIKKITALILAFGIILSMSGCNNSKNSSSQSESSSSASTDTTESSTSSSDTESEELAYDDLGDGIVMNIGGFDVSEDEYKYYFAYAKSFIDNGDKTYWDNDTNSSKLNDLKAQTLNYLFNTYTIYIIAKENGVELTDEEKAKTDKEIDSTKLYYETTYSNKNFDDYLKSIACTKEIYRESLLRVALEHKTVNALYETDFRNNYLKDFIHVKYVLVVPKISFAVDEKGYPTDTPLDFCTINPDLTYTDEETAIINKLNGYAKAVDRENLKASISELMNVIHARLEAGESIDTLIEKYNYNPAEQKDESGTCIGSYISADTMQKEFSDNAFALAENQISAPFFSTGNGHYIVQRIPFDEEYLRDNILSMYMNNESYPYASKYQDLCTKTQETMKVVYDHRYDDIKADYATAYSLDDPSTTDTASTKSAKSTASTKSAESTTETKSSADTSETKAASDTKKPE